MELSNLTPWLWEYNGKEWGFDPRISRENEIENFSIPEETIELIVQTHYWKCVRKRRDDLLKETDWVGGEDVPQSLKDKWYDYRQQLRDITTQSTPMEIVWPNKP